MEETLGIGDRVLVNRVVYHLRDIERGDVVVFEPGQAPDSTSFRSARIGSEESFYWIEERFGYALSGDVNGPDMQALAREVYGQLER